MTVTEEEVYTQRSRETGPRGKHRGGGRGEGMPVKSLYCEHMGRNGQGQVRVPSKSSIRQFE